ncbi:MAG: Gfo/Idh/MocA family oxidoreductase, partial [Acidimicrobiales bacterium]
MIDAAIVGCGLIGDKRAASLQRHGARIVAVHDVDTGRAAAMADRWGGAVAPSLDALLEARPDLVVVATDHASLCDVGATVAAAGCHLLLEKPGGRTAAELRQVQHAAERSGVTVRVGYNHRFHPSFLRMRELGAAERFGPLLHVRARYGHGGRIGYEREWRADRARSGGGELIDQAVHLIDLTRFVTGDDVSLAFAELRTDFWAMDVEDNAFLALRPRRGGFAWLHASWTEWKNLFSFEVAWQTAKFEVIGLGGSYGVERLTF